MTFKPRQECKTCNCQSKARGCTWPVLHKTACLHDDPKPYPIGDQSAKSQFEPDEEEEA